jgi:HEPN domain-containing protein
MKDETRKWVEYANENLYSSKLLLESKLFNPCLQNVQQAVEKILKAMLVESSVKFLKTHSIAELVGLLAKAGTNIGITLDSCELLDSIYLPSKYPFGGVLPDFEPDEDTCRECITIAEQVFESVEKNML